MVDVVRFGIATMLYLPDSNLYVSIISPLIPNNVMLVANKLLDDHSISNG